MEKKIEKYLIRQVEKRGGLCLKNPPLFTRGLPDRSVILPQGRIAFVEVKSPGGLVSAAQKSALRRLVKLGHIARVLDSREAIDDFLNEIDGRA